MITSTLDGCGGFAGEPGSRRMSNSSGGREKQASGCAFCLGWRRSWQTGRTEEEKDQDERGDPKRSVYGPKSIANIDRARE